MGINEEKKLTGHPQKKDFGIKGKLNKDKVNRKYLRRTRKILKSELNARNKVTAHNCFAVAMDKTYHWDFRSVEAAN